MCILDFNNFDRMGRLCSNGLTLNEDFFVFSGALSLWNLR